MMKRCSQDNDLICGLTGYLETLQLAGVDAISLDVPNEWKQVQPQQSATTQEEPLQEETMPKKTETVTLPIKQPPLVDNSQRDPATTDRVAALQQLAEQVAQCKQCPELASRRTQTVFGGGDPFSELVFLGEAPGADEDRQGIPFVGRAGKLLTDMIEKGMKLHRDDVYICNILRCRPPDNRNPAPDEAARCRPFLDATLQIIRPKYLCCLGSIAASNLLDTQETIGRLRGRVHDYQGIKVVCTYHPAYLLRNPSAKSAAWDDLKLLMREMGLPITK